MLLTTVYHTNDRKHIFKLHFKNPVVQVLLQVAVELYISGPFYELANLTPKPALFLYTYAIIQGVLVIFYFFFL